MDPIVLCSFFPILKILPFFRSSAVKKIVSNDRILANLHIMLSVFCLLAISEHFICVTIFRFIYLVTDKGLTLKLQQKKKILLFFQRVKIDDSHEL